MGKIKVVGVVVVVGLAMLGTGCAGKVRMTSAKMCAAHGGTFNAANKTCSYTAATRSAQQTCDAHGGYYDPAADVCEFNP